jgi:transposase
LLIRPQARSPGRLASPLAGLYPFWCTEKQAWDITGKKKETGKKNQERRVRAQEFKAEATALAEKREKPVSQLAVDLWAHESALRGWMQQAWEGAQGGLRPFSGHGRPREEEPARLWKEAKALREANEILKKAVEL